MKCSKFVRWLGSACLCLAGGQAAAQSQIYTLPGDAGGDQFGRAVRFAGDADLDGVGDLLVASDAGVGGRGYARLISGAKGTLLVSVTGAIPGEGFGFALAGLGDLNGDGRADFAVGAPLAGFKGVGRVDVFSGLDGAPLFTHWGNMIGDHFGYSLAGIPDVSGDGVQDLAVGALDDDDFGPSSGTVRVISGASGATLYTLQGTAARELFGTAVAGLHDLNGDGRGEILVGSPFIAGTSSTSPGLARVFSGADGALLYLWTGASGGDVFGRAVANAGDANGDGFDDAIIGAPQAGASGNGYARLYSGATGLLLDGYTGAAALGEFGASVAAAGDVDQDGRADVAIGAPSEDGVVHDTGAVYVFSGRTNSLLASAHGGGTSEELGGALDFAGDVNRDGIPDLVLGSTGDAAHGSKTGSARVLSTRKLALASDVHLLSFAAQGSQSLTLDADASRAGLRYMVIGSISGTQPGMSFRGMGLALNSDRYTALTLSASAGVLQSARGKLDPSGRAAASFRPPKAAPPSYLVGLTFHHAFVVLDATGRAVLASNAVPVTILP